MTRTPANSPQAAKGPVAATPGASLPLDASVLSIVANLEGHDLNGLRRPVKRYSFSPNFKGLSYKR